MNPIYDLLQPGGLLVTDNVLQEGDIIESRYAIPPSRPHDSWEDAGVFVRNDTFGTVG